MTQNTNHAIKNIRTVILFQLSHLKISTNSRKTLVLLVPLSVRNTYPIQRREKPKTIAIEAGHKIMATVAIRASPYLFCLMSDGRVINRIKNGPRYTRYTMQKSGM